MERDHQSDYDAEVTSLCERTLVTLIGDVGPWSQRIYLVGGLAPRYIVGMLPQGVSPHVGTTDVDLVIGLAIDDDTPETYETLQTNLKKSGFAPGEDKAGWRRSREGRVPLRDRPSRTRICLSTEGGHGIEDWRVQRAWGTTRYPELHRAVLGGGTAG